MQDSVINPILANQNLQNRSFVGQNLTGADFSGADLRGCDFTNANLQGANFTQVITGRSWQQSKWLVLAMIAFWGVGVGELLLLSVNNWLFIGTAVLGVVITQLIAAMNPIVKNNPQAMPYATECAFIRTFPVVMAMGLLGGGFYLGNWQRLLINSLTIATTISLAIGGTKVIMKSLAVSQKNYHLFAWSYVNVLASYLGISGMFALIVMWNFSGTFGLIYVGIMQIVMGYALAYSSKGYNAIILNFTAVGSITFGIILLLIDRLNNNNLTGLYYGSIIIFFVSIFISNISKINLSLKKAAGTSFRWSNLTGASFAQTKLYNCDFLGAKLEEIDWQDSQLIKCQGIVK